MPLAPVAIVHDHVCCHEPSCQRSQLTANRYFASISDAAYFYNLTQLAFDSGGGDGFGEVDLCTYITTGDAYIEVVVSEMS